jgi:hypothetical protein
LYTVGIVSQGGDDLSGRLFTISRAPYKYAGAKLVRVGTDPSQPDSDASLF